MTGSESSAVSPKSSFSVGTVRQSKTATPSARSTSSTVSFSSARTSSSCGRNNWPTAYVSGRSVPSSTAKNESGRWTRIPAPSPVFDSAPVVPRCSRLASSDRPSVTMSWSAWASRSITTPTPQFDRWSVGSARKSVICERMTNSHKRFLLKGKGCGIVNMCSLYIGHLSEKGTNKNEFSEPLPEIETKPLLLGPVTKNNKCACRVTRCR